MEANHTSQQLMNIVVPPELRPTCGLRYSRKSPWAVGNIHAPLHYRHPVSGEEHFTTLQGTF